MDIEDFAQAGPATGEVCPPRHRKPRLNRREASDYLAEAHGITRAPSTLATLACRGDGPRFQKLGRTPLYAIVDLDEWANRLLSKPVASTSEMEKEAN